MNVLLETSPLRNANAIRGVGVYTRYLSKELEKLESGTDRYFTSEDVGLDQLNAFMSKKGIDLIHYPYFSLFQQTLPLPFTQRLLGKSDQKIVVTIHDVIPLLYPEHYPVGISGNIGLFLQKQALTGVAAVITDSETSKRDITKYLHVPSERIFSIPLAGNPELQKSSAEEVSHARSELKLPEQYILFVGDINYNKNIPALLEAMRSVPSSVHLVCVGVNFRPHDIPEWNAIAAKLPKIQERVHCITTIAKDDVKTLSAVYTGALAYVQPSHYEGFGLPLLEAMQCGTQVISSDTPALKEIGGSGVEFVHTDAQSLAEGINTVIHLSAAEKTDRLSKNRETLKRFSWAKTARETVAVYKTLV